MLQTTNNKLPRSQTTFSEHNKHFANTFWHVFHLMAPRTNCPTTPSNKETNQKLEIAIFRIVKLGGMPAHFQEQRKRNKCPRHQEAKQLCPMPQTIFRYVYSKVSLTSPVICSTCCPPRTNSSTTPGSNKETNKQLRLPFVV